LPAGLNIDQFGTVAVRLVGGPADGFVFAVPQTNLPQFVGVGYPVSRYDSQTLARLATRAEIRQPGAMERMFGHAGGASLGGVMATSLLSSIAGAVIGSMIAREFFSNPAHGAADSSQDWQSAENDQALGEGDGFAAGGDFDGGGFDV
jgi:hypothetical protein